MTAAHQPGTQLALMREKNFDKICCGLRALGHVWIHLNEYRITHGYLHLLVTGREFRPKLADVYFSDCATICGPTSGGPWEIDTSLAKLDEGSIVVMRAGGGDFVVRALRVSARFGEGDLIVGA